MYIHVFRLRYLKQNCILINVYQYILYSRHKIGNHIDASSARPLYSDHVDWFRMILLYRS